MSGSKVPHVITLGTAGGPRWWRGDAGHQRAGIATAVVVGESVYLVDAGHGAGAQLSKAGLGVGDLRSIFLTHLHSDHVVGLAELVGFGFLNVTDQDRDPITIIGPGDRGALPPVSSKAATAPEVFFPQDPTPGTGTMLDRLLQGFATDINDRMFDSRRPTPYRVFEARDVEVPREVGFHANSNPTPEGLDPFEVYRDEDVVVTATLVQHQPVAPAFAFRFDTPEGSVTISGDTGPCDNLVRLASGTDLLLHEAIDLAWAERAYEGELPETARASVEHHRKAHTTPEQAGSLASRAGVGTLALHHLVPGNADPQVWRRAEQTFAGPVLVPDDLECIEFGKELATTSMTQPVYARN